MINKLSKAIYKNNVEKGFYEGALGQIGAVKIALIHSEASEALEADRVGRYCKIPAPSPKLYEFNHEGFVMYYNDKIKGTVEEELADIMIRVMDFAAWKGIDLEGHILAKTRYNSLREYKHGKNY